MYAATHKANANYLALFDAIDAQPEYNEQELKTKLANRISPRNFARLKHHLYTRILEAMGRYDRSYNRVAHLYDRIAQGEFLLHKGLFSQCLRLARTIRKEAERIHSYEVVMQALDLERQANNHLHEFQKFEELMLLDEYERELLIKKENELRYKQLKDHYLFHERSLAAARTEGAFAQWRLEFFQQTELQDESLAITPFTRRLFHHLHARNASQDRDVQRTYRHALAQVAILEQQPLNLYKDPLPLALALHPILDIQLHYSLYTQAHTTLEKLAKLKFRSELLRWRENSIIISRMFFLFIHSGRFAEGLAYARDKSEDIAVMNQKLTEKTTIETNLMLLHFGHHDYAATLTMVNNILARSRTGRNADLYKKALLLAVIIHYELDNFDLLESAIRAAYRYLLKYKVPTRYDVAIQRFFRVAARSVSDNDVIRSALETLERDITSYRYTVSRVPGETGFDLVLYWIRSKLSGHTIEELAKEAAQREESIMQKSFVLSHQFDPHQT